MSGPLLELLASLGTALAAGFLVGAERQYGERGRFGGARTFPLMALAGAIAMVLGTGVLIAVAAGVGLLVAIAYYRETGERTDVGMSTEMAALVTFGLGALCTADEVIANLGHRLLLVAALAAATLALLSFKRSLHGFIARLSEADVYATTKLLLLALIVVPLLPDEEMGPFDALNPRTIGLLVLLISAVSFVGYVAVRTFGPRRGLGLTGLLGGLASSTAVTLSFAGRAREVPALVRSCGVAILLASSVMFLRLLVVLFAVSPALARGITPAFTAAAVVGLLAGTVLYRHAHSRSVARDAPELNIQNPLSLSQALRFAALFLVVLLASRAAAFYLGDEGAYLAALITGVADADSISLSLARMQSEGTLGPEVAQNAVAIAAAANTAAKAGLAGILGGVALGWRVTAALGLALGAGAAVHFAF
ncbi:MAG: MgtC/SapB family protein [Myxococcota bacterium]